MYEIWEFHENVRVLKHYFRHCFVANKNLRICDPFLLDTIFLEKHFTKSFNICFFLFQTKPWTSEVCPNTLHTTIEAQRFCQHIFLQLPPPKIPTFFLNTALTSARAIALFCRKIFQFCFCFFVDLCF